MPITLTPLALCELAHIAVAKLRVTLMVAQKHEGRNEKVGGNNCPTLLVEYRPSS